LNLEELNNIFTMRNLYRLTRTIFAVVAFFAITTNNGQLFAQGLTVQIRSGTTPVTYIEDCAGNPVVMTVFVSGGTGSGRVYTWSGDLTYFTSFSNIGILTDEAPAGTYYLTVNVVDGGGFSGSASVEIKIKPSPSTAISTDPIDAPTTFCQGGSVKLIETLGQSNVTFHWERNYVPIPGANSTEYYATETGGFRVVATSTISGCQAYSDEINVTVNPLPLATASNDGPYCHNQTINLTSGPDAMVSYNWTTTAVTPFTSGLRNPSIPNATASNSGVYTVTVEDINGCVNTAQTTVTVYLPVTAGTIGTNHAICYNTIPNPLTNTTLPSGGNNSFTYQWQWSTNGVDWNDLAGEQGSTYTPSSSLIQTTQYRRQETTSCSVVYSNIVTVTVYSDILGGTIEDNQTICHNTIPNQFSSTAPASGGNNIFTYQWQWSTNGVDWNNISGANGLNYTPSTALTQTTQFRRQATTDCAVGYSNIVIVTVYDPVVGGTISDNQSICYNTIPAPFLNTTPPSGGDNVFTYQWQWSTNGVDWFSIAGATGLAYTPSSALTVTTQFRRQSTTSCATVFSNAVTVTVLEEVVGGTIEANQTICYNTIPLQLNSTLPASGGNNIFTYQWQWSTNGIDWNDIASATGLSYTPASALTQTTQYRRQATTTCGSVYSNIITITVLEEVLAGAIEDNQTICYNTIPAPISNVTNATGGNNIFTYQWQSSTNGVDWTNIAGATGLSYTPATALTQTTLFRRQATTTCATVYSNIVTVTVLDQLLGGTIEANQTICYNTIPSAINNLTAPTGGTNVFTYQWQWSTNGVDWFNVVGETGLSFTPSTALTVTTHYRRQSFTSCGVVYSNPVIITVLAQVVGGTIDLNQTICYNTIPGTLNNITAASGGNNVFTYLWQWSTNGVDWNNIAGATNLSYTPTLPLTQTTQYRRQATTACAVAYSNTVTITVRAQVLGGSIENDIKDICYDTQPDIFYQVTPPTGGTNSWTYQWQYQEQGQSTWTPIVGSNTPSYTHPTNLTITTKFRRLATDALCGFAYSNEIEINVWENINPGEISIADNEVCHGESPGTIQNLVSPTGGTGTTTFYWEQRVGLGSWTLIVGASSATYTVPTLTQTTSYRRWASNSCGTEHSNEITITVHPLPNQYNITGSGEYCEGSTGVAIGLDGSQLGVTYTLYLNGTPTAITVAGTGSAISFGFQPSGDYTVYAQNNATSCNIMMLGNVLVTEIPEISNNSILDNQLICSGGLPSILTGSIPTGGNGAGTYTYQWHHSINGTVFTPIAGATGQDFTPPTLTQTTWYQREVLSGPCSSFSNTIEITVNQPIGNNTISTSPIIICYDTAPSEFIGSLPTNGSGIYTYQWQLSVTGAAGPFNDIVGAESQSYQHGNLTSNTWFRRIVRSMPCDESYSNVIQITVSPEFIITGFTTVPTACSDSNDGEAEVNHTGGTSPYSYSWSNGQTTKRATGLSAGVNYTVTVTDNIGCPASGTNTVTITSPDPIEIDDIIVVSIVDLDGCYGDAIGSIQVLAKGGTPNFTYSLYRDGILVASQTPIHPAYANFTGLVGSNNYRISVTDSKGCTPAIQSDIVLAQPDQLFVTSVEITDAICYAEANGTITVTAAGGIEPYIYSINGNSGPFVPENTFMVAEGNYEVWVMDANGCLAEYANNSVYIGEPDEISVGFDDISPVTGCYGNTNGLIVIKPFPTIYEDYLYSIVQFPTDADWYESNVFNNLPAGTYYPKVKHKATGCIVGIPSVSYILTQPTEINFSIINITNVTGCWYNTNGSFRVTTPVGGQGLKTVSIDGVVWRSFPYTFSNLGVGTYTVYAKDANNCIVTKQVVITGPPAIEITNIDLTHNFCYGDTDGSIDVTAIGGTGALSYTLLFEGNPYAGPQVTGLFENLAAGNYILQIRDANNCLLTEDIEITSPNELVLSTEVVNVSCSDSGNEGIIRAMGIGGTAPYSIILYLSSVEQQSFTGILEGEWVEFTGLSSGTDYEVEIRDTNYPTCSEVYSGLLNVVIPDPLEFNLLSLVIDHLICNSEPNGKITIAGQGGTLPYTYTLFDSENNPIGLPIVSNDTNPVEFENLMAGEYWVSIDDANNCGPVNYSPIIITEPDAIEIDPTSINITNISCFGANDGEITLLAIGGTGDLHYTLTQGGLPVAGFITQTNNGTFGPLAPGTYVIEITDDLNCGPILSTELTVIEPDPLEISTIVTDALCNGLTGEISALASEGTAPYVYTLKDGADATVGTQNGSTDVWVVFADIAPGTYTLHVEDASGCENSTIVTVEEPTAITVNIVSFEDPTCDASGNSTPGVIVAEAFGGSGVYTYSIYHNGNYLTQNNTGNFNNLAAGTYYVEVYDSNNCGPATSGTQDLISPTDIVIDEIIITNALCYDTSTGTIEVIVSNAVGTPLFTITAGDDDWQTSNIFTNLSANNYTVRVKDDNNCVISSTVTINQPNQLEISIIPTPPTTALDSDGTIEISTTGGTPNYWYELYIWDENINDWVLLSVENNTSLTTHTFIDLGIGIYQVVVTDANGCSVSDIVPLSQFAIVLIATHNDCHYDCEGTITLSTIGGDYVTLSWEKDGVTYDMDDHWDETTGKYINLCSGSYTAYATDDEGNDAVQTVFVGPATPDFNILITNAECRLKDDGQDIGSISISYLSGGNGTPANGYLSWSYQMGAQYINLPNFNDMWSLSGLPAGNYRAVYTDVNGCKETLTPVVNPNPDNLFEVLITHDSHSCYNSPATLVGSVTNGQGVGATYEWYRIEGNNSIPVGTNSATHTTHSLIVSTNYRLDVYSSKGCFENRNITIDVYPEIGPFIDVANPIFKNTAHYNDSEVISVLADTEYPVEILTQNADYTLTYSWTPAQFVNPSNEKNSVLLFKSGTFENLLTGQLFNSKTQKNDQYVPLQALVQSEFGCVESFSLKAIVLNRINISNVFSPNGDGINDIWTIPQADAFPNLEITIMNRWGAIIWSAKGSEAAKGWDGNNSNGKPHPIGTYYYVVNFNVNGTNKWKPISGSVTIVR
jgi:gliding motility-associated-like protein